MLLFSTISLILLGSVYAVPVAKPSASPITLPFEHRRIGRADGLANGIHKRAGGPATAFPVVNLTVGDQFLELIIDTGSGNTWVGSKYQPSHTSRNLGHNFSAFSWGVGLVNGTEYTDKVSLFQMIVPHTWIGVVDTTNDFPLESGIDGVLGLGPSDLTVGTVDGEPNVPTFMQSMVRRGSIQGLSNVVGILFDATNNPTGPLASLGQITFGGADLHQFSGDFTCAPRSLVEEVSLLWAVDLVAVSVGTQDLTGINGTGFPAAVVTGVEAIALPADIFASLNLHEAITVDNTTGLGIFHDQPSANISFNIGGTPFTMTPEQYLLSPSDIQQMELPDGPIYTWITSSSTDVEDSSGPAAAILGAKFLQNFYLLLNAEDNVVCLAQRA